MSLKKAFTVPPQFRTERLPGQIPGREAHNLMAFASQPAPKMTVGRMLDLGDSPRFTVESIVKGLGLDRPTESGWRKFLEGALVAPDPVSMRKALYSKFQEERTPAELRNAIFQRSMSYLRTNVEKSLVIKSEPRGGSYYRRVPKGDGFRYFYDPDKYHAEEGAHVAGDHAMKTHMTKKVGALLDKAGLDGCGVEEMKGLARKFGADKVAAHLREGASSGNVIFKGGRFYRKGVDSDEKKPEPKKFTVKPKKKESGK